MHQYQDHTLIQEHIANWKTSGLTQVAYCQQHAIKPHIFSYYKKKFAAAPAAAKKDKLMPVKLIPEGNTAYLREIPYELMASRALLRGFLSSG